LANAVLSGEHVINGSFAVVLGDNFFYQKSFLDHLISYHLSEKADATLGASGGIGRDQTWHNRAPRE
jgi:dTDP-glucose pyrophosphorylase